MRIKQGLLILLVTITAIVGTGCWDARDINDKALITLVVTDRQDDKFVFYVEVPNLAVGQGSEAGANQEQYSILSGAGSTYAEARRQLDAQMDKPIFLGTVRALILTEKLASFGIEEYFYRMQAMADYRRALDVVTTRCTPADLLSSEPENNISTGYEIDETINSLTNSGKVVSFTVSDVMDFLYEHRSFVLINMDLINGRLAYDGYSIIRDGKYEGFIPLEEAKALVWLLGSNGLRNYTVQADSYLATVEVRLANRSIKAGYKNGQVSFDINLSYNSQVLYLDKNILFDARQAALIKNKLQTQLRDEIAGTISRSRALRCDYLGMEDYFRIAYPTEFSKLDWSDAYGNAIINISVNSTLDPGGMTDMKIQGQPVQ